MKIFKLVLIAVALVASGTAQAACGFKNSVSLKSLTAGFQAWKSVTSAMAECGNFEPVLDQEFRKKQPVAFRQIRRFIKLVACPTAPWFRS